MKVFVSHKKEDSALAAEVANTLKSTGHEIYLDVVDNSIGKSGDDLADYLRGKLSECDSLIAVVSASTQLSWWVPWEIGVATEKDYPLSTYLSGVSTPPEYLMKWPVLRSMSHLRQFAGLASNYKQNVVRLAETKSLTQAKKLGTADFHRNLKRAIGQS